LLASAWKASLTSLSSSQLASLVGRSPSPLLLSYGFRQSARSSYWSYHANTDLLGVAPGRSMSPFSGHLSILGCSTGSAITTPRTTFFSRPLLSWRLLRLVSSSPSSIMHSSCKPCKHRERLWQGSCSHPNMSILQAHYARCILGIDTVHVPIQGVSSVMGHGNQT
jgi:hypothetical protein